MHPNKCLKICVSKMAIASILRQIPHSSNSQFLLDNFDFVQKIQMGEDGGGGGGGGGHPVTAKLESGCDCDVYLCWQSVGDY